ncbi:hypothetical protein CSUI_003071 [Cystoisospora suis]|uniref:Uncharacterized protein n=1 Tax=Cystoisospora suis TaxID=483139 RepID=A0A2C6L5Q1_9APIC|nr:hypothetical protein CSUI_003071 [Cystoisospora suis]
MRSLFSWLCVPWVARTACTVNGKRSSAPDEVEGDRTFAQSTPRRTAFSIGSCFPFLRLSRTKRKVQEATCCTEPADDKTPGENAAVVSDVSPRAGTSAALQQAEQEEEEEADVDLHEPRAQTCFGRTPSTVLFERSFSGFEEIFSPVLLPQGASSTVAIQRGGPSGPSRLHLVLHFEWDVDDVEVPPATESDSGGINTTTSERSTMCDSAGEGRSSELNSPGSSCTPQYVALAPAGSRLLVGPRSPAAVGLPMFTDRSSPKLEVQPVPQQVPAAVGLVESCQRFPLSRKAVARDDPMQFFNEKVFADLIMRVRQSGLPLPTGMPRTSTCRLVRTTSGTSSRRERSPSQERCERRTLPLEAGKSQTDASAEPSPTLAA